VSNRPDRTQRVAGALVSAAAGIVAGIVVHRATTAASPPLDHFGCYTVRDVSVPRFAGRGVTLADDFGGSSGLVARTARLCGPADKNGESIPDPTQHLMCYRLSEPRPEPRSVVAHNQFGDDALTVRRVDSLCVPAAKNGIPPSSAAGAFLDHFKCYRVRAKGVPHRTVTMADAFGARTVTLGKPALFCNPADKNGEGIPSPTDHLTCYKAKPSRVTAPPSATVDDQFSAADGRSLQVNLRRLAYLCVPSQSSAQPSTTSTTTGTTTTTTLGVPTCSLGSPPACGGTCLPGTTCQVDPIGGLVCLCLPPATSTTTTTLPVPTCSLESPPTCGGTCLPGTTCQVDPIGGLVCLCLPPTTSTTTTTLPLPTCSLGSPPTCGGTCLPGTTCQVDPVGGVLCLCLPPSTTTTTTTILSTTLPSTTLPSTTLPSTTLPPTTLPSTTLVTTTTTSTITLPTCSLTSPPTCGGTCPAGTTCQVDPIGGLLCLCL
jgi:hypothetical protein